MPYLNAIKIILLILNLIQNYSESAKDIRFEWEEKTREGEVLRSKKTVSVQGYFREKYNRDLKYPHLPCLEVGNPNKVVKLPLEFCRLLPHQRLRRSMTNSEKSEMTSISGQQSPKNRIKMCEDYVDKQFHSGPMAEKNRPFLYEFGINVDKNLLKVDSRVIAPPTLKYGGTSVITPNNGTWEMYPTKAPFYKAKR